MFKCCSGIWRAMCTWNMSMTETGIDCSACMHGWFEGNCLTESMKCDLLLLVLCIKISKLLNYLWRISRPLKFIYVHSLLPCVHETCLWLRQVLIALRACMADLNGLRFCCGDLLSMNGGHWQTCRSLLCCTSVSRL
jgi:hypothetical protein